MIPMVISIAGADEDTDDFRPVPSSDRGDGYRDRGMLGGYSPSEQPFASPDDVRFFAGFGADEDDLKRGYCKPSITDDPAYDLENYKDRSTMPLLPDVSPGNDEATQSDFEFRNRNRRARGFLTRPHGRLDRG